MAYCIWVGTPRYGSRDEILGTRWSRHRCFTKRRAVKKAMNKLRTEMGEDDAVLRVGGRGGPSTKSRIPKRKPSSARSRRQARREHKQPGHIPF